MSQSSTRERVNLIGSCISILALELDVGLYVLCLILYYWLFMMIYPHTYIMTVSYLYHIACNIIEI